MAALALQDWGSRRQWWIGVVLFLVAVVAFLPAVGNGFIWDDDQHVTANAALRSGAGLWRIWFEPGQTPQYYPLAFTIFWVEFHVWGLWAAGYHVVNLVGHGVNVVLLWRVLRRIGLREEHALVAAALWGVHPVQVETVDWVMEIKNVSSTFFYLLSARCLLRAWGFENDERRKTKDEKAASGDYSRGVVWFVMALYCKTVTASLPGALLLVIWWRRGRVTWADVKGTLPLFVMGGLAGWFTAHMEAVYVGAQGSAWDLSAAQRVLIAGRVPVFYAAKLFWPWRLEFFYPRWEVDPGVWWQWAFPVGAGAVMVGLGWVCWRWKGARRGDQAGEEGLPPASRGLLGMARGCLAGILFFGGTLFPALGFVNVYPFRYSFVADHFQYLACAGILVLAAWVIVWVGRRMGRAGWGVVAAVVVVALGVRSYARCFAYKDLMTLYADQVAQEPNGWVGHSLLGSEFARAAKARVAEHDPAGAAELARRAEGLFGAATQEAPQAPEVWQGWAASKRLQGRPEEAEAVLRGMLARMQLSGRPLANVYYDLGGMAVDKGDRAGAEGLFAQAIAAEPGHTLGPQLELGKLLAEEGKFAEAAGHFAAAVKEVPEEWQAHLRLGECLAEMGRYAEAEREFEVAVRLNPESSDAQVDLQRVRGMVGR